MLGMPLSAYLVDWIGWPAPFYFYGVVGVIWYGAWLWLVFEKPCKHPTITPQELLYIEKSIGPMTSVPPNLKTTPWRDIFTSMPVWAIVVANFCRSWTFYLLIISQPTYFKEIFKLPVKEVSIHEFYLIRFMYQIISSFRTISSQICVHLHSTEMENGKISLSCSFHKMSFKCNLWVLGTICSPSLHIVLSTNKLRQFGSPASVVY